MTRNMINWLPLIDPDPLSKYTASTCASHASNVEMHEDMMYVLYKD